MSLKKAASRSKEPKIWWIFRKSEIKLSENGVEHVIQNSFFSPAGPSRFEEQTFAFLPNSVEKALKSRLLLKKFSVPVQSFSVQDHGEENFVNLCGFGDFFDFCAHSGDTRRRHHFLGVSRVSLMFDSEEKVDKRASSVQGNRNSTQRSTKAWQMVVATQKVTLH